MLSRRIKIFAGILFTLVLFESVPSLFHIIFTEHQICAEHGDVLHSSSHQSKKSKKLISQQIAVFESHKDNFLSLSHHEHCNLVYHTNRFAFDFSEFIDFTEHNQKDIIFYDNINILQNIPLTSLAPKLSPPSLAHHIFSFTELVEVKS